LLGYCKPPGMHSEIFEGHNDFTRPCVDRDQRVLLGCGVLGFVQLNIPPYTTEVRLTKEVLPAQYKLYQNYPNPFNPLTSISFDIKKHSYVKLKIFDINGREVMTIFDRELQPGSYEYVVDGGRFASGVYYYSLHAESDDGERFSQVMKMLLLK